MGVDARLVVKPQGDLEDTNTRLSWYLASLAGLGDGRFGSEPDSLRYDPETGTVTALRMERHYFPGRGKENAWPTIRRAASTLSEAFPGCPVYYLSDNNEVEDYASCPILDGDSIAKYDSGWLEDVLAASKPTSDSEENGLIPPSMLPAWGRYNAPYSAEVAATAKQVELLVPASRSISVAWYRAAYRTAPGFTPSS